MKYIFLFLIFSPIFVKAQTRNFEGNTQTEMNFNASEEYQRVDSCMQSIFNKVIHKRKQDTLLVANLKRSQTVWIDWRSAEIKSFYPDYQENVYGSMAPLCTFSKLIEWTEQRIAQLNVYLHGVEEGDACGPGLD